MNRIGKNSSFLIALLSAFLIACGGGNGSRAPGGDNDGGGAGDPSTGDPTTPNPGPDPDPDPEPIPDQVRLSGRITYDRIPGNPETGGLDYARSQRMPLRRVVVEAVASDLTVLATDETDEFGNYEFQVAPGQELFLMVFSELSSGDGRWLVRVVDNTNGNIRYALVSARISVANSDREVSINAPSGFSSSGARIGNRSAAPFAIMDTMLDSFALVEAVDPNARFPDLSVGWSIDNRPDTSNPGGGFCDSAGALGSSFYGSNMICILGAAGSDADEYDDSVIAHEWGHFFEDALSRSDSFGGEHAIGQSLDPRVAFSEGLATALAAMSTGRSIYIDSMGAGQSTGLVFDVESNDVFNPGWFNEGSVQSIVYDLFDSANDGVDQIELGFAPLFDALTGAHRTGVAVTSIFTLIAELRNLLSPTQVSDIDAIVEGQQIVSTTIDPWGSTETNSAGNADVLPVYVPLSVNGPTVNLCSTDAFGIFNKLSNGRLMRFTATAVGTHTITATPRTANADAFLLLFQGDFIDGADATFSDQVETLTVDLTPGEYVLEVADFANISPSENFPSGRFCFDVRVVH